MVYTSRKAAAVWFAIIGALCLCGSIPQGDIKGILLGSGFTLCAAINLIIELRRKLKSPG